MIRRPSRTLPALAHQRRRPPLSVRKSCDIKVPGAFIDFRLSFDLEQNLDEHAKQIEVLSVARSESGRELKPQPPKSPIRTEETRPGDSNLRYREKRPGVPFLQTRVGQDISRPQTAKESTGKENLARDRRFKRLGLGDMTDEFDKISMYNLD
jgi:hypothetical protein